MAEKQQSTIVHQVTVSGCHSSAEQVSEGDLGLHGRRGAAVGGQKVALELLGWSGVAASADLSVLLEADLCVDNTAVLVRVVVQVAVDRRLPIDVALHTRHPVVDPIPHVFVAPAVVARWILPALHSVTVIAIEAYLVGLARQSAPRLPHYHLSSIRTQRPATPVEVSSGQAWPLQVLTHTVWTHQRIESIDGF